MKRCWRARAAFRAVAHGDGPERLAACLLASPSTQREEAGGDSKLVLGGWAAFAWRRRRRRRKRSRWSGEKAWSSHLWLGRPLSSKPPSVSPFYSCNMIARKKKTLFLEKKHLFHHNQCSGEPKNQAFFRSWRKVAMISAQNYFFQFDVGGHPSQN